jgi:exo-beta-1,3-glucanase (GH17 family)
MKRALAVLLLLAPAVVWSGNGAAVDLTRQQWNGNAICYSGYRLGQHPDKEIFPSQAQVLEDLRILERNWKLIRVYGSDQHSRDVLEVIRKNRIELKVMLGMWMSGKPGKQAVNEKQVAYGIQLANEFPDIVAAVNVGNEALVSWSDHRMEEAAIVAYVDRVRKAVKCPVTVADDVLYWTKPGNQLVDHVDFITLHTYPLWGKQDIENGLSGTVANYEKVRALYPAKTIHLGEVGWATYTEGEQHAPRAGSEENAKRYYGEINAWARAHGVTAFIFEAFDEPWKGQGTEGHWGLFSESRKAKLVMQDLYPDLKPSGPTSPAYDAPAREEGSGKAGERPKPEGEKP